MQIPQISFSSGCSKAKFSGGESMGMNPGGVIVKSQFQGAGHGDTAHFGMSPGGSNSGGMPVFGQVSDPGGRDIYLGDVIGDPAPKFGDRPGKKTKFGDEPPVYAPAPKFQGADHETHFGKGPVEKDFSVTETGSHGHKEIKEKSGFIEMDSDIIPNSQKKAGVTNQWPKLNQPRPNPGSRRRGEELDKNGDPKIMNPYL